MNLSFCEFFGGASEALTLPFRHGCFQVFTSGHDTAASIGGGDEPRQLARSPPSVDVIMSLLFTRTG